MMRPRPDPRSVFISLLVISFVPRAISQCYYPNGTLETDPSYQPCPGFDGTARMCCATNRTNPFDGAETDGWTANKCLPNGLCLDGFTYLDQQGHTTVARQYWRDLCTSSNWNEGGCLRACTANGSNTTVRMTPCGDANTSTTWCCGDTTDCCNSSSAVYIPATLPGYINTSTTTTTTTMMTTTSAPSSSTFATSATASTSGTTLVSASASSTSTSSSQASSSQSSSGLSTGAKAGIGVGIGVGALVVLAGLALILRKKRGPSEAGNDGARPGRGPGQGPSELSGDYGASEMPTHPSTVMSELSGDSVKK